MANNSTVTENNFYDTTNHSLDTILVVLTSVSLLINIINELLAYSQAVVPNSFTQMIGHFLNCCKSTNEVIKAVEKDVLEAKHELSS